MSDTPAEPAGGRIRLGYPSSPRTAHELLATVGLSPKDAFLAPYDLNDPFSALRKGELDVLIVKFDPDEADLEVSGVLGTEQRAAVLGSAHPLAGRDSLSIEELADYDGFECPGSFPAYLWDEVVPPRTPGGRVINRRHRATSIEEMMGLVVRDNAVHISVISLADMAPPALRIVPIHDLPPTSLRLARRAGTDVPPHVTAFVEAVESACRTTVTRHAGLDA
ncbi:DNA-binding transcriptional LysR family regulator [Streptomyces sp. V3I8]|uniref:LysR substrate-binding domain-containing protein n=1 Tax=Streptomyces sp. V3I8 TaxID=3042279 RepID=UPI00278A80DF|nr:LysR substrate-binding domain-containing protein [Streptomyces sp. V3I8]MDQ1033715.1 DNA-binding transcriptional LysR family regulator [Streptomyces sp. V3I8]